VFFWIWGKVIHKVKFSKFLVGEIGELSDTKNSTGAVTVEFFVVFEVVLEYTETVEELAVGFVGFAMLVHELGKFEVS